MEINQRWGTIAALCRIGFPALALGDTEEAPRCFGEALEKAQVSEAISLQLLALSGIGALLAREGEATGGATMLTFALGHEQLPAAYGFAARPALDEFEATLPSSELDAARAAAASATAVETASGRDLDAALTPMRGLQAPGCGRHQKFPFCPAVTTVPS